MDLFKPDHPELVVTPRGMAHTSGLKEAHPFTWTSRYGSVGVMSFGLAVGDGMNEKGLDVNLLYLANTAYEPRDHRPGVSTAMWTQYVLDNFATVDEALNGLKKVQIVPITALGMQWPFHIVMSDATGDSAVVEFINGKVVIHHGPQVTVVTNEPTYDEQIANLKHYKAFGGSLPLPGDIDPVSRFVRASTYLKMLPPPKDMTEAIAGAYDVARNVAVPPGAQDTSGQESVQDAWPTLWVTVADSTHKTYFFQSMQSPSIYWVDLGKIDFSAKSGLRKIDANDPDLAGDITARVAH